MRRELLPHCAAISVLYLAGCAAPHDASDQRAPARPPVRQPSIEVDQDSDSAVARFEDENANQSLEPLSLRNERWLADRPLRDPFLLRADAPPASAPAAASAGPLPRFGDTVVRDLKNAPGDLWTDVKHVYGNPINLAILGSSYAGALALQESGPDDTVEDHYNRHHTFTHDWRDAFGALGNPATHFALAGAWYLAGQQAQDNQTYEVGRTLFSALLINGASVMLGQLASADRSPNGEFGTFPSGHTSSAFVLASVMHEAYGPWVGVPLYGLGTLVAIERLDDREHYLSDVVFGGVMGLVIGHSVASGRDPEVFGWKILPYADPVRQSSGIAFYKSWP